MFEFAVDDEMYAVFDNAQLFLGRGQFRINSECSGKIQVIAIIGLSNGTGEYWEQGNSLSD